MLKEAALGATFGFSGSRKAPHVPALAHPQHYFLVECTSTFFSGISAFFTIFSSPAFYIFAFFPA